MTDFSNILNVADMRWAAKARAHRMVFDYIDGAADDERTAARNQSGFTAWQIKHRVLTGVGSVDTCTSLLGHDLALPFILSPAACQRLFHTVGEKAGVQVAAELGTVFCLSTLSSTSIEEIGALTDGVKWFQLYVWKDRGLVKEMLDRAKAAGFSALILTVDLPVHGNRERDPRNGFTIPPKITWQSAMSGLRHPAWTRDYLFDPPIRFANIDKKGDAMSLHDFVAAQLSPDFNWQDAEWLLGEWAGPAVIKGVVHPDDAVMAVQTGFQGIGISNHGGRQLDGSAAPIDVLPQIAEAVEGRAELILDGGVRRGADIIKALALGAKAVSFARPYLYGLAAGGTPGVRHMLALMAQAVRRDMALAGMPRIDAISRDLVDRI